MKLTNILALLMEIIITNISSRNLSGITVFICIIRIVNRYFKVPKK